MRRATTARPRCWSCAPRRAPRALRDRDRLRDELAALGSRSRHATGKRRLAALEALTVQRRRQSTALATSWSQVRFARTEERACHGPVAMSPGPRDGERGPEEGHAGLRDLLCDSPRSGRAARGTLESSSGRGNGVLGCRQHCDDAAGRRGRLALRDRVRVTGIGDRLPIGWGEQRRGGGRMAARDAIFSSGDAVNVPRVCAGARQLGDRVRERPARAAGGGSRSAVRISIPSRGPGAGARLQGAGVSRPGPDAVFWVGTPTWSA